MFKKLLLVFVVAISAMLLVACGEKTYAADGVYTAFSWELTSGNGPQVTSVSVTIEKDKVTGYFIDCIQSTKTVVPATETELEKVTFAFNAKTKKELGNEYGMKGNGPKYALKDGVYSVVEGEKSAKEWFEQAKLIEDFFLANGPEALTVDKDGRITNVNAGVTIKDGGYSKLAKDALALAKEGKVQAWVPASNSVVFATGKVNSKGAFTELTLDTIQGSVSTEGKFVWNAKTKQQLGNEYGMKGTGPKYKFENGKWAVVPNEKAALEWFEQAKLITDYVLANGITGLKSIGGQGVSLDGTTLVVASVSVKTDDYFKVLGKLYNNLPSKKA